MASNPAGRHDCRAMVGPIATDAASIQLEEFSRKAGCKPLIEAVFVFFLGMAIGRIGR